MTREQSRPDLVRSESGSLPSISAGSAESYALYRLMVHIEDFMKNIEKKVSWNNKLLWEIRDSIAKEEEDGGSD